VEIQCKVSHGASTITFYPISTNFRKWKRVREADGEMRYQNSRKLDRDSASYNVTSADAEKVKNILVKRGIKSENNRLTKQGDNKFTVKIAAVEAKSE